MTIEATVLTGLNIGAVAKLSGLTAHVIRAWEKRYGLLTPQRLPNGRRAYTKEDAVHLGHLAVLIQNGHQIGRLATLDRAKVGEMAKRFTNAEAQSFKEVDARPIALRLITEIIYHLERYKVNEIARLLVMGRNELSARIFVLEVLAPLMARIGLLVEKERLSIVQEHVLSAIVRAQLYKLVFENQGIRITSERKKAFAFVTPEGDHHEIGILMAATLAMLRGNVVQYLGPNLPAAAVATAAKALKTNYVVIGWVLSLGKSPGAEQAKYLKVLSEGLPSRCRIFIGSRLDTNFANLLKSRDVRHFPTLERFDEYIARI